jgi:TPP-dependent pyruvate/acetoin dehydrogenase alpha subunit
VVGSAAALKPSDEIFSQYRESASLLYRGFTIQEMADQVRKGEDTLPLSSLRIQGIT